MKKLFILFVLSHTTWLTYAQLEWLGKIEDVKSYGLTSAKNHLLLREYGYFTVIDSLGTLLYDFPENAIVNPEEEVKVVEVFELLDSSFMYFYWSASNIAMQLFDVGITINSDWDEGSGNYLPCSDNCGEEYRSVPFDNSSIIKYGRFSPFNSTVQRLNILNGQSIWEKDFNGTTFYSATVRGNHIFICTDEGIWKLDGDGNIIQQWQGAAFEKILPLTETSFVVQQGDTLVHFSENLLPLDTVAVPQGPIEDWDIRNGHIGVLNANDQYMVYDGSLEEVGNFSLTWLGLDFQKTQVGDGSLFLAGNFTYGPSIGTTSGVFIKEFSMLDGSDLTTPKDIGVVDVNKTLGASIFQQGGKYYVQYDTVFVTVKNFGDSAIHRFVLKPAYYPPTTPNNYAYAASKGFSNINPPLAPGESRTFAWTGLNFAFEEQPTGEAFDICVISSYPNDGIDVDSSNDVSCTTFLVGTGQALKERMDLLVYPNPASTAVTLELVEPLPHPATWSLYDPFGREVRRVVLPARQQVAQTNLGGVPHGFYFWRLSMQGQVLANGKLLVAKK